MSDGLPTHDPTGPLPEGLRALEASAGTGKTFSIVSTVLRLVVERELSLDRLLVVTFTRAATAELLERVRTRLGEGAAVLAPGAPSPEDEVLAAVVAAAEALPGGRAEGLARVERARQQLDEATIATLHGFCQRVLQQAAFAADVDPALEVDTDDQRLVATVVDDWAVALLRDAPVAFLDALADLRLDLDGMHAIGRTVAGEPDPVLEPAAREGEDPVALFTAGLGALRDGLADGSAAEAWLADQQAARVHGNTRNAWQRRYEAVTAALAADEVPARSTLEELAPDAVRERAQGGVDQPAPTAVGRYLGTLTEVERSVRTGLAAHVAHEVPRRRLAAGTASFSDLLRLLARALDDPATARRLVAEVGSSVDAVLIDEFQDTDPVQWRIFSTLFADVPAFEVVGDPKQAIYGWRGADLATYFRAVGEAEQHVTMGTNWRSDGPYVAACNAVLGRDGHDVFGDPGVGYVRVEVPPHHATASLHDPEGEPRSGLELVVHRRPDGVEELAKGVAQERVVEQVAQDVVGAIDDGWTIDGRPVGAGDCAVLVRTNADAAAVASALRRRGVAVVVGGGADVLASDEAGDVADLLALLLEPRRERLVRRVQVGPFGGEPAAVVDDPGDEVADLWAERLAAWTRTWEHRGVAALVDRAVRDAGTERRLAALRDGDRVLTNLRHLAELLHAAEREEALGTHALLAWLQTRRADAAEGGRGPVERELRLERDEDAVRVMTVHTAKGLEFPLVWVTHLWRSDVREENAATRTRPFVVNHPDHGARVVVLHPAATDEAAAAPVRTELRAAKDLADWQASLRLAYVALTRAVHRCSVHVPPVAGLRGSALWQLLFADRLPSGRPGTGEPFEGPGVEDDELLEVLGTLAEHPAVELREVGPAPVATVELTVAAADAAASLSVAAWPGRTLDAAWARTSYTGLVRRRAAAPPEIATAADEADHDELVVPPDPAAPVPDEHAHVRVPDGEASATPVPLAQLPRGAAWGTYVHAVLEHLPSFDTDADELRRVALARSVVELGRPVDDRELSVLVPGLLAALRTPLAPELGGMRLAQLPRRDRLDELRFTCALAGPDAPVDTDALADVLERHADDQPGVPLGAAARHLRERTEPVPVHGLLGGAIDLTLRRWEDGTARWWVADYKTNGLGRWVDVEPGTGWRGGDRAWVETVGDHHPAAVLEAMVHHDYLLQAHLYTVALHRFLRARLGTGYDPELHLGGWTYLFLRGMTGEDVATTADGRPYGVATGSPSVELLDDLEAVLGGPRGAA